jgi:hypothetical protein
MAPAQSTGVTQFTNPTRMKASSRCARSPKTHATSEHRRQTVKLDASEWPTTWEQFRN